MRSWRYPSCRQHQNENCFLKCYIKESSPTLIILFEWFSSDTFVLIKSFVFMYQKKNPFERVQSTNRRMTTPCPQSRRFLSRTAYASDQQGSCEWGPSTSPGYQYSAKSFNFSMAMFNELGNKTQYLGLVDNYAIGKCPEEGTLLIFFPIHFLIIIFYNSLCFRGINHILHPSYSI